MREENKNNIETAGLLGKLKYWQVWINRDCFSKGSASAVYCIHSFCSHTVLKGIAWFLTLCDRKKLLYRIDKECLFYFPKWNQIPKSCHFNILRGYIQGTVLDSAHRKRKFFMCIFVGQMLISAEEFHLDFHLEPLSVQLSAG